MHFGPAQGSALVPKSVEVPWKSNQTLNPKKYVEKDVKFIAKSSEIDPKIGTKVNQKRPTDRNLRFLCFCKEYKVKIVFWDDHGHLNRPQNQQKLG